MIWAPNVRTAMQQTGLDHIDAAATPARLRLWTAGKALLLADIPLADPAGSVAGDVVTLTAPVTGTYIAAGTAAVADIVDGDGNLVLDFESLAQRLPGDPATGAEVELSSTTAAPGIEVTFAAVALNAYDGS